ncbi:MAG: hypothetical protein HC848_07695 [Limnobacter sp.]|nr:hypothetical protein [Limnobacter sp.]
MKAQKGPGMPLAVVKAPVQMLQQHNATLRIGQDAVLNGGGFSTLPETLFVQAKISADGTAAGATLATSDWVQVSKAQLGQLSGQNPIALQLATTP